MGDDSFARSIPHRKEVPDAYKPNSFRVLTSEDDVKWNAYSSRPDKSSSAQSANILGQPVTTPLPYDPWAFGRPPPLRSRLLHGNVTTMMEPVSDVITNDSEPNSTSGCWWRHPRTCDAQPAMTFTLDTTSRNDFQRHSGVNGSTRHSSNPNKTPAVGGVPVTWLRSPDGRQRYLKEGISYEHQYDSRLDSNYPPRGKRQGNFVWDIIPNEKVDQFLLSRVGYSNRLTPPNEQMQKRSEARKSSGTPLSRISNPIQTNEKHLGQTPVAL